MNRIVWLASYPKSGNTWFRAFLTNFLRNGDSPVSINDLDAPIATTRRAFDEAVGYDSGEMTNDEVDRLRPDVYLQQSAASNELVFRKVHDAYTFLPGGKALFPAEATACAVYFIRNPLDVAVSFAHHNGDAEFDRVIDWMASENHAACEADGREMLQFRQKLLSWSSHVKSWADAPGIRVLVLRYEDMKLNPEAAFAAAVLFIGLEFDSERIRKAVEFSRFEELRRQEERVGFCERMPQTTSFFRNGEAGSWRLALRPEQASRLLAVHNETMRRFGYLDDQDNPVF